MALEPFKKESSFVRQNSSSHLDLDCSSNAASFRSGCHESVAINKCPETQQLDVKTDAPSMSFSHLKDTIQCSEGPAHGSEKNNTPLQIALGSIISSSMTSKSPDMRFPDINSNEPKLEPVTSLYENVKDSSGTSFRCTIDEGKPKPLPEHIQELVQSRFNFDSKTFSNLNSNENKYTESALKNERNDQDVGGKYSLPETNSFYRFSSSTECLDPKEAAPKITESGLEVASKSKNASENRYGNGDAAEVTQEGTAVGGQFDFQKTAVGAKLKTKLKSDFLASELTGPQRSLGDIMAEYGIVTDNLCKNSSGFIYGKEEDKGISSGIKVIVPDKTWKETEKNTQVQIQTQQNNIGNSYPRSELFTFSKTSSLTTQTQMYKSNSYTPLNSSQNNENNPESKRPGGTSVDADMSTKDAGTASDNRDKKVTSSMKEAYNKDFDKIYSGSNNFLSKPFEYKYEKREENQYLYKANSFGTKPTENYADEKGNDGVVTEEKADFSMTTGSNYDFIKSLGSLSEAIGYSLNQEKERLRKIDNMITGTPVRTIPNRKLPSTKYTTQGNNFSFGSIQSSVRNFSSSYGAISPEYKYGVSLWDRTNCAKVAYSPKETNQSSTLRTSEPSVIKHSKSSLDTRGFASNIGNNSRQGKQSYDPELVQHLLKEEKEAKTRRWAQIDGRQNKTDKQQKRKGAQKTGSVSLQRSMTTSHLTRNQQGQGLKTNTDRVCSQRSKPNTTSKSKTQAVTSTTSMKSQLGESCQEPHVTGFDFVRQLNKIWSQSVLGETIELKDKKSKYHPYKAMDEREKTPRLRRSPSPPQTRALFPGEDAPSKIGSNRWAFKTPTSDFSRYDSHHGYSLDDHTVSDRSRQIFGYDERGTKEIARGVKGKQIHPSTRPQSARSSVNVAPRSILKNTSATKASRPKSSSSLAANASKSSTKKKSRR